MQRIRQHQICVLLIVLSPAEQGQVHQEQAVQADKETPARPPAHSSALRLVGGEQEHDGDHGGGGQGEVDGVGQDPGQDPRGCRGRGLETLEAVTRVIITKCEATGEAGTDKERGEAGHSQEFERCYQSLAQWDQFFVLVGCYRGGGDGQPGAVHLDNSAYFLPEMNRDAHRANKGKVETGMT